MGGMTIGLMGNAEQASIANIAFGTNQIDVLVQNSGSTTVNITQAYINGAGATITNAQPWSVDKSSATTLHITATLSAGTSYQIKLITAKGTQIQNSAVYNP
jgi:P pilus assembly chaperone PapD